MQPTCSIFCLKVYNTKILILFRFSFVHRVITADELREVMKTLGDYMTNEDIEEMVAHADKNGDGRIDYEGMSSLPCALNNRP